MHTASVNEIRHVRGVLALFAHFEVSLSLSPETLKRRAKLGNCHASAARTLKKRVLFAIYRLDYVTHDYIQKSDAYIPVKIKRVLKHDFNCRQSN